MNTDIIIEIWKKAQHDLKLEIDWSFCLDLDGRQIKTYLRLKYFGGKNGMLIVEKFSIVKPFINDLSKEGFGFCVTSFRSDNYCKESFIEMLAEWGWMGDPSLKPSWIKSD